LNPKLVWYIENPVWILRKMYFMQSIWIRNTVTYCQYWDNWMKPTDIWTNNIFWIPRKMCKNWSSCHIQAPRGSRLWTQWLTNAYERSRIPRELCVEILGISILPTT
jgi:hypothetical protein